MIGRRSEATTTRIATDSQACRWIPLSQYVDTTRPAVGSVHYEPRFVSISHCYVE